MRFSELKLPSDRKFSLFFSLVFSLAGIYTFVYFEVNVSAIFFCLSVLLLIIAVTKPSLVSPLNKMWMFIGFSLGRIISPIILGIIFFLLISPLALMLRISGRDELNLKFKSVSSYWKIKSQESKISSSFRNQF